MGLKSGFFSLETVGLASGAGEGNPGNPKVENGDIPHFLAKGDAPAAGTSPFAREAGK
jgi:hypothetical protein